MQELIAISNRRVAATDLAHTRFLLNDIDRTQRLIVLLGHRGAGKTTLLLQMMGQVDRPAIYISLDNIYFEGNRLVNTINQLYEVGYRDFFLDEVHRYPHWSADLKQLYDSFPDIHLIVTGSSILEVSQGQADLSRRASLYHLPGLSLREYLKFSDNGTWDAIPLQDILDGHATLSGEIADRTDILRHFREYLHHGHYPFFLEGTGAYTAKLREAAGLVIDLDIQAHEQLNYTTVRNLRKLLYIISRSVPFKPNISKLAEDLSVSRNTLLMMLELMHRANLIALLRSQTQGISFLQKPEKIYLHNPNLMYAFAEGEPGIGNLREAFFLNQLSAKHRVTYSKWADFTIDDRFTFEIGGPSKTPQQIRGVPQSFLAVDGITHGSGNRIPLWLFGFLY